MTQPQQPHNSRQYQSSYFFLNPSLDPQFLPPLQSSHIPGIYNMVPNSDPEPPENSSELIPPDALLSHGYEREMAPLVSERQSSSALAIEYANGDPVYRTKTAAIPQKYSHYRTCKGDGHCGWRAVAFCYFETLARVGNKNKFFEEETRLRSLKNLLNSVGFDEELCEDFAEPAFELLHKIQDSPPNIHETILLDAFNDDTRALSIFTYLKLLTSAWMQIHATEYIPFVPDQDVQLYCQSSIEPAICEIEHVGMKALVDVLVKPAGFAIEILYLDRTPGDEVNVHRMEPLKTEEYLGFAEPPTLRLLYRPGHYDILYEFEEVVPMHQEPVYVALAGQADEYTPFSSVGTSLMGLIPGMSLIGPHRMALPCSSFNFPTNPNQTPQISVASTYQPVPVPTPDVLGFANPNLPVDTPVSPPICTPIPVRNAGQFRPSAWELEPELQSRSSRSIPFQTPIFQNSHFNTAHFLNPDFQPEVFVMPCQDARPRHKPNTH